MEALRLASTDISGKSWRVLEKGARRSGSLRCFARISPSVGGTLSDSRPGEVTALLRAWHAGDEDAYRRVTSILYSELRRQAAHYMRRERPGEMLQTTALVHEAWMRLAGARQVDWQDRNHFLAVAARTMRRLLVDLSREHAASKRGSRAVHVSLDVGVAAPDPLPLDIIALEQALERLAALDARKVQVVELKFFAGLTVEETADVLGVSPDTVARDWRMARTWLLKQLSTARA
jgi:RNA polymerase sigma factor (TIGR02999 family)